MPRNPKGVAMALENAEKSFALAVKATKSGFFKKPNWETAANNYREAIKQFNKAGPAGVDRQIEALRGCAVAHEHIGSTHTAASNLEAAAKLLLGKKQTEEACSLYEESAMLYRSNGNPDKSADVLMKAADTVAESDLDAAVGLMDRACAVFEEEERGRFSDATFQKATAFYVKVKRFEGAVALLVRQQALYQADIETFATELYKNFLSLLVIRFAQEKYEEADEAFKKMVPVAEFTMSDQYVGAEAMFGAWRNGSQEEMSAAAKTAAFIYLPNQLARLAKKIKFSEATIAKQADVRDEVESDDGADPMAEDELDLC